MARSLAAFFEPSSEITIADGPMNVRPAEVTAWAKPAFSDRKP